MTFQTLTDYMGTIADGIVIVLYKKKKYFINNLYRERGNTILRPIALMSNHEKAECDIIYGEENNIWSCEDLKSKLEDICWGARPDSEIKLDLSNNLFSCTCEFSDADKALVFKILH